MSATEATGAVTVTIRTCARCDKDHADLTFNLLTAPAGEWTHWAICPTVRQPILLQCIRETPAVKIAPAFGLDSGPCLATFLPAFSGFREAHVCQLAKGHGGYHESSNGIGEVVSWIGYTTPSFGLDQQGFAAAWRSQPEPAAPSEIPDGPMRSTFRYAEILAEMREARGLLMLSGRMKNVIQQAREEWRSQAAPAAVWLPQVRNLLQKARLNCEMTGVVRLSRREIDAAIKEADAAERLS